MTLELIAQDSPGHSAKYESYTVIDVNKNRALDVKLAQVAWLQMHIFLLTYTQYHMEKEGL